MHRGEKMVDSITADQFDDSILQPRVADPSALETEFQNHLAVAAKAVAENMGTRGLAAKGTREALHDVGIDIPPSDSADIKQIPKMHEVNRSSVLEPGDVVVVDRTAQMRHGNSFVVTNDKLAASDHVAQIPNLSSLPNVHIFRTDEKK
jgi:hypothetical protein